MVLRRRQRSLQQGRTRCSILTFVAFMGRKRIILIKWSCRKRVYVGFLIGIFVACISVVALLSSRSPESTIIATICCIAVASSVIPGLASPETWIDNKQLNVHEGIVIGSYAITIKISSIHTEIPLVLREYPALQRTRVHGYYLGIRTKYGRIIWFAYDYNYENILTKYNTWKSFFHPVAKYCHPPRHHR